MTESDGALEEFKAALLPAWTAAGLKGHELPAALGGIRDILFVCPTCHKDIPGALDVTLGKLHCDDCTWSAEGTINEIVAAGAEGRSHVGARFRYLARMLSASALGDYDRAPPILSELNDLLIKSAAPPVPLIREHPIPEDSILARYRDFAREVTEAPDCWIMAPILALCAKIMTPAVSIDFAGWKPLTLFNFIAGPAGMRKSTTFSPARAIANAILGDNEIHEGNASDSALFDVFFEQPHRLQFEDEGNTMLVTWSKAHYGQEVSGRYLKLYDGSSWRQTFRRAATKEDATAGKKIDRATLSLCLGSTFGVSRFAGVDAASGLRRRFGYYVATRAARALDWAASLDHGEINHHAEQFRKLATLQGVFHRGSFSPEGWEEWRGIQSRNRARIASINGYSAEDEALAASLNESAMRILKLAIIFQACRWAAGSVGNPYELTSDVLRIAEKHQDACLEALVELDSAGRRGEVDDVAQSIFAQIVSGFPSGEEIRLTKSDLTRRFAHSPGRPGAMTPSRLYGEIIPRLIAQGLAREVDKAGKKITYGFTVE